MAGISPELNGRLRAALLNCAPFASDRGLRDLFVDARLVAWRHQLATGDSPAARVSAAVDFLSRHYNRDRENGIVLLLHVLAEQHHPDDALHGDLLALAAELAVALHYDVVNIQQAIETLLPPGDPRRHNLQALVGRLRQHNELLREWKQLHQHLDTLSNITYGQYAAQLRRYRGQAIDPTLFRDAWRAVALSVRRLLEWARTIEYIGPPYRETDGEKAGPQWAIHLGELVEAIDDHLAQAPPLPPPEPTGWQRVVRGLAEREDAAAAWSGWWWPQLTELSDSLEHEMRLYMSMADENLRSAAADLYDLSQQVLWSERQ